MNAASSIVQNFAPIGRRSSEITRGKKEKKHSKTEVLPKTIVFGRTKKGKKGKEGEWRKKRKMVDPQFTFILLSHKHNAYTDAMDNVR